MDRKTIEREQVVQRYLAGDLTVREAREFEQYIVDHPEILKDLPIPVRLKAKLAKRPAQVNEPGVFPSTTSIEVSEATDDGFDQDEEDEHVRRIYGGGVGRGVVVVLVVCLIAAIGAAVWYATRSHSLDRQATTVQREAHATQTQAAGSIQNYTLELSRAGPPTQPTLSLGWPQPPVLMEIKVNVSSSKYNVYQITIDSETAGRLMQIRRIARDSNGDLHFAINSSAFGPGNYLFKFDGYTWRGQTEDYGWLRIALQ
jgi:hypothetical protein